MLTRTETGGSVYLFDVSTGQQVRKLNPSDGAAGDYFGVSIAVQGDTAVIGAPLETDNYSETGSAYVFDVSTGQQLHKLSPSEPELGTRFGMAAAIDGDVILVAAPGKFVGYGPGAVYGFDLNTGQELFRLTAEDGFNGDRFGRSVALEGDLAVIGAWDIDHAGIGASTAYVFDISTQQQLYELVPSNWSKDDRPGAAVAISGMKALVGSPDDDDDGSFAAAAYVFCLDCNGNGLLDSEDIAAGTSQDCNGNSLPDECDLAYFPNRDWNGDGALDDCVPANYCTTNANSSGVAAVIGASGTPVVAMNDVTLEAWSLPLSQFGYFLTSESSAFVPNFGGSSGNLCLGSPLYRFINPASGGQVLNSGSTGTVSLELDLAVLPQGITFDAGETWYFQLWFRDQQTSNTTDGIEVLFR